MKLPSLKGLGNTDLLMWGGLGIVALATWGMLGTSLERGGTAIENIGDTPFVSSIDKEIGAFSNFAWSEGVPWRDRSIWYQWKGGDWGGNDPTKRLTVA